MIVPVILNIEPPAEKYTKQNSKAAFNRLREHLHQYCVLLKGPSNDPQKMLQLLRDNSDPAIGEIIKHISEEVPIKIQPDWDGQLHTIDQQLTTQLLACVSDIETHPVDTIETIQWQDIDAAHAIETIKTQRKITRLSKDTKRNTIWDTYFRPIYTLVPINRIEIIDRYLLTNVITNKSEQLNEYLDLLNDTHSATTKPTSLIIYSSKNNIELSDIRDYFDKELVPKCQQLAGIAKVCLYVCNNYDFSTHYHDRYIISTMKDKVFYVHNLGIGLEILANKQLTKSQECSLMVHTPHTVHQYRSMLNHLEEHRERKFEEYVGANR